MMKSIFGVMVLSIMALATVPTPLPGFTNTSSPLFGTHTSNVIEPIVQRQVGTNAFGSSCSDEGAWFCMANSFQRCASGEWSVVQSCAPGTQCEPLGITHNASQPAFGIYDGNSNGGTTMTDPSTTNFGIEPVTKTTTIDVMVTDDSSTTSSIVTSSANSISTRTGTSTTSSKSSSLGPEVPKADTSRGARMGGMSWSTMSLIYCTCLFGLWRN